MDATVNGYYDDSGITVNISSSKALNSIVGHELTHALEGSEFYDALKDTVLQYAKDKGDYDSLAAAFRKIYQGKKGYETDFESKLEREIVADLIGDYVFTDADFINNLSTKHRNVFQKLYDEVKYLVKVATAGSKEARQLEKVKKLFDEAYRNTKNTAQLDGVKYSITEPFVDNNGTQFDNAVLLDTDFFDDVSPRDWGAKLRKEINKRASNDPVILPIVDENGNTTLLQFANPDDRVAKDGGANHKVLNELSSSSDNISKLAVIHIDEIVSVSEENLPYYTNENRHKWLDKNGWLHRNANVINRRNGNIYNLTIDIAKAADGRTILYATNGKIKKVGNVDVNSLKIKGSRQNSNFKYSLSESDQNVNTEYSGDNVYGADVALERRENSQQDSQQDGQQGQQPIDPIENLFNGLEEIRKGNIHPAAAQPVDPVENLYRGLEEIRAADKARQSAIAEEGSSIKEQLRNSQGALKVMQPVAEIHIPTEFHNMDKSAKQNWVIDKLRPTNYQVNRKGFGIISFAQKHLKSAFNYFLKGSAEEVAFEALPKVLESGIQITNRAEHKERGYGTVTIAAPIEINGMRGNMAVVVKQTTNNFYKVHRILTPDGAVFALPDTTNEAEPTPAGESPQNGSLATPIGSASMHIISESKANVNFGENDESVANEPQSAPTTGFSF